MMKWGGVKEQTEANESWLHLQSWHESKDKESSMEKKKRENIDDRKKKGRNQERWTDGGRERRKREKYSHAESDAPNQLRCCQSSSP